MAKKDLQLLCGDLATTGHPNRAACNYSGSLQCGYNTGTTPPPPTNKDSDGDGIFDEKDSCPYQKEVFNNYQDNDGCPDVPPVQVKGLQTIKYGTLNWVQTKSFSYFDWSGVAWTAQILGDGKFSTIKYGTLNWIPPQKNIQIKRVVVENGQEVEQNVMLEVAGTRFQYIVNGTLNWNVVPNFEYRSWELVGGQTIGGRTTVEIVR